MTLIIMNPKSCILTSSILQCTCSILADTPNITIHCKSTNVIGVVFGRFLVADTWEISDCYPFLIRYYTITARPLFLIREKPFWQHDFFLQCGKIVIPYSPWLVNFAVKLVDSVFDSPTWK